MTNSNLRGEQIDAGEGFLVQTRDAGLLYRRGLLGKGVLHFANGLADLDADYDNLPVWEWDIYQATLFNLIWSHSLTFYTYLLAGYGVERINPNLWRRLAHDLCWPYSALTLTAMPTEVLEDVSQELWVAYKREHTYSRAKQAVVEALADRTDIYGSKNMPTEMAFGILFEVEPDVAP